MMLSISKARRIVEAHGHSTATDGRRLIAEVAWSQRLADGSVESGTSWERVPLTVRRLRDWLGY